MLSLDESLDQNTSLSNTKFFFPLCLGLLLLCTGMQIVMLVRALNVEAGSAFVFKDAISGTVLRSCWIVSSVVLVGSTGQVIVQVSFAFLLAFVAASLFLISFLSPKSFRQIFVFSPHALLLFSLSQSSSVDTYSSMTTLVGLIFSSCLTGCKISARSGDINPVDTNRF